MLPTLTPEADAPGQQILLEADITLYAQWRAVAADATDAPGGPATAPARPVAPTPSVAPPTRPARLPGRFGARRAVATTTGAVPRGATRIIQTARSGARSSSLFLDMALQGRVRTARGRCTILRPARKGAARTYRCQMRLARGTWTVTTTARGKAGVVAQGVRTVRVR